MYEMIYPAALKFHGPMRQSTPDRGDPGCFGMNKGEFKQVYSHIRTGAVTSRYAILYALIIVHTPQNRNELSLSEYVRNDFSLYSQHIAPYTRSPRSPKAPG